MNKLPRANHGAAWYEVITQNDEATHRPIRVYRIECHKCGTENILRPNLSPDRTRKAFIRQGWEIGKSRSAHTCVKCIKQRQTKALAPAVSAEPPPPPPPPPPIYPHRLLTAWERSSEEERELFLELIAVKPVELPAQTEEPVERVERVEPVVEDDDDEPADWWKQIANVSRRKTG